MSVECSCGEADLDGGRAVHVTALPLSQVQKGLVGSGPNHEAAYWCLIHVAHG